MNDLQALGLHHAAYRCRNASETRDFYEGVLGFPLAQALTMDSNPATGEAVRYIHLFFDIGSADPRQPSYIAFFEVDEPPGPDAFVFKPRQSGLDLHFAMAVRDHAAIAAWRERLLARGVAVEGPVDHGICTSIYFHDPNGYRLEFTTQDAREHATFAQHREHAAESLAAWARR